ncbi:MAG: hypothetical protein KDJ14_02210 [Xanthomonadales bacterium]|nr:hypothetical protein [Xanthomonadales bacterium]
MPLRHRLLSALIGLALAAPAAAASLEEASVVRVGFDDLATAQRMAAQFGHARIDEKKHLMQLVTDAAGMQRLREAGLTVQVDALETERLHRGMPRTAGTAIKSIGGFPCYRTVEETFASLDQLETAYPDLLSVEDIGETWQEMTSGNGYPMRLVRLTNRNIAGPKPKLMFLTSIHAREYTPAEIGTRFVEKMLADYGRDADATWIIDHHEILAVLQANPDGRKRAETGQLWRKNTNTTQCGGSNAGVDLNRNFPFEWGMHGGSSPNACDETYRGTSAASEPETWSIVDRVRSEFPDRRGPGMDDPAPSDTSGVFIDIHSYSQLVLWPWGHTETLAPNSTALATLGRRFAWYNGYTAEQSVGLYPTDGTTDDFAYGELGVAAFTVELGNAFFESCGSFENNVLDENIDLLEYAARVARAPYLLPAGPSALNVTADADLVLSGQPIAVTAQIDDTRFHQQITSHSGPAAPVHAITGANLYLDVPPWDAAAVALPMSAVDGSFNTSSEAAELQFGSGLSAGRHIAYVQGEDAGGAAGPVSATFVEVIAPEQAVSLHGRVSDYSTGTSVAAQISANQFVTSSDAGSGQYSRILPAGSFDISVQADGHETLQLSGLDLLAGSNVTRDFRMFRLCPRYEDPAEAGSATPMTPQSPWTLRAGRGRDGGSAWVPATGTNYSNNLNVSLTSPTLDFSGYAQPTLQFESLCNTEAGWDFGIVEVRVDAGTWEEVYRCDGSTSWEHITVALPQFDDQASAQLRFRFTSDGSQTRPGWAVDQILIEAGGPSCRATQQSPNWVFGSGFEAL